LPKNSVSKVLQKFCKSPQKSAKVRKSLQKSAKACKSLQKFSKRSNVKQCKAMLCKVLQKSKAPKPKSKLCLVKNKEVV
jgi:hypothetical protein